MIWPLDPILKCDWLIFLHVHIFCRPLQWVIWEVDYLRNDSPSDAETLYQVAAVSRSLSCVLAVLEVTSPAGQHFLLQNVSFTHNYCYSGQLDKLWTTGEGKGSRLITKMRNRFFHNDLEQKVDWKVLKKYSWTMESTVNYTMNGYSIKWSSKHARNWTNRILGSASSSN